MQLVIADSGPINYLVLIGDIDLLPRLFGKVVLPKEVCDELTADHAPVPAANGYRVHRLGLTFATPRRKSPLMLLWST